jgi:hypothetical protein
VPDCCFELGFANLFGSSQPNRTRDGVISGFGGVEREGHGEQKIIPRAKMAQAPTDCRACERGNEGETKGKRRGSEGEAKEKAKEKRTWIPTKASKPPLPRWRRMPRRLLKCATWKARSAMGWKEKSMIKHAESESEQVELTRNLGRGGELDDLVERAKKVPGEIHLFTIAEGLGKISVALAFSDEARAELERLLRSRPT